MAFVGAWFSSVFDHCGQSAAGHLVGTPFEVQPPVQEFDRGRQVPELCQSLGARRGRGAALTTFINHLFSPCAFSLPNFFHPALLLFPGVTLTVPVFFFTDLVASFF